jgi:hypothetical protein
VFCRLRMVKSGWSDLVGQYIYPMNKTLLKMKRQFFNFWITVVFIIIATACSNNPVKVCPTNPHYFYYKDKPLVLVTSDHHYGAIIDLDFDYVKFLEYLAGSGMNLTRIYPGGMFEPTDKFIPGNPLGPRQGRLMNCLPNLARYLTNMT